MHPVVHDVPPVQPALVVQVPLKLLVDVGDDRLKAEGSMDAKGQATAGQAGPSVKDNTRLPGPWPPTEYKLKFICRRERKPSPVCKMGMFGNCRA